MDWKEIVNIKPESITDENRDAIFTALVQFQDFERTDNKSFKKLFKLSQHLMRFKEELMISMSKKVELDLKPTVNEPHNSQENTRLRKLVDRLESEKSQQKVKFKQLTEEIQVLQKRVHATSEREDSPDALSDLDKQQDLLNNISLKNKHIKRLIRDLDELESKSTEQLAENQTLKSQLYEATLNLESLNSQFKDAQNVIQDQINIIEELNAKNRSLDNVVGNMQQEVEERENEIFSFGKELEKRAMLWKKVLDEKQNELDSLRVKYDDVIDRNPGYNIDAERAELKMLTISIKERDCLIQDLEEKVFAMSSELLHATDVINKLLVTERKAKEDSNRPKSSRFSEEASRALAEAKHKLRELEEHVLVVEEDNVLKSKQALEAIDSLNKYVTGQSGLPQVLEKVSRLEQRVRVRDKEIKELVKQINRSQDVAKENIALREQLGIPEDEVVPTTFIEAKQRKAEKLNERLTLKLRASEELRLKLKLEKNELKKRLQNNDFEACQPASIPEDLENRKTDSQLTDGFKDELETLRKNYETVVEENENLRIGMHEILHKLRNYDATSNNITIDTDMLERLLHALDARSISGWYHPAMRMQNELLVVKERELALKEQLKSTDVVIKSHLQPSIEMEDVSVQTDFNVEAVGFDKLFGHLREQQEENSKLRVELDALKRDCMDLTEQLEIHKSSRHFQEEIENKTDTQLSDKLCTMKDVAIENALLNKKLTFLLEENAGLVQRLRTIEISTQEMMFSLKQEMLTKVQPTSGTRRSVRGVVASGSLADEIKLILAKERGLLCNTYLDAAKTDQLLKRIDEEQLLGKFAVIDEDSQVAEMITKREHNELVQQIDRYKQEVELLKEENCALKEALDLKDGHLRKMQELVNRNSDAEISLRHLVVDLQSSTLDKQLLARNTRDLNSAHETEHLLRTQIQDLIKDRSDLSAKINLLQSEIDFAAEKTHSDAKNFEIKCSYLKRSLILMYERYSKYTPLLGVEQFVKLYQRLVQDGQNLIGGHGSISVETALAAAMGNLKDVVDLNITEEKINIVRWRTKSELLESQLLALVEKLKALENELAEIHLESFTAKEHWTTLKLLLDARPKLEDKVVEERSVQTDLEDSLMMPIATVPDTMLPTSTGIRKDLDTEMMASHKSMESQLKQAMILASTRSTLLLDTESRLLEAQGRLKALEQCLEEKDRMLKEEREKHPDNSDATNDDNILSITIASLQNLLLEKDTTLSRYQDLLKTERNEHSKSCDEYRSEIEKTRSQHEDLQKSIREKDSLLEELQRKCGSITTPNIAELKDDARDDPDVQRDSNKFIDDSFNESKEFELEEKLLEMQTLTQKLLDSEDEVRKLHVQLREVSNREKMWERNLNEKDQEIALLNGRLNAEFKNTPDNTTKSRDLKQLKELLEEKDRHINDLTDTLTHFHDDQQMFIKDTTLNSAEEMSQLTADFSRTDATNKVLNTQLDALKRQIASLSQREKQARELVKTLKTQLLRRPVISVKDQKVTNKETQLQRRVESLQNELQETKEELRKQVHLAESRRLKSAQDLNLWEKHKRAQQNADKLKLRLSEREQELEKLKMNLASARQAVSRLEREKSLLESRHHHQGRHHCESQSCPNNTNISRSSPESDKTEPEYLGEIVGVTTAPKQDLQEATNEVIRALKSRIETQQRKIVAMELEGKGPNVLAHEMEKMQERLAALEAQNLRLEARNLQLQLDNDLIRQGDENERQKGQIKHLEDYILVLKEELSEAMAATQPTKLCAAGVGPKAGMEQTILALKRIVERLRVENKNLKESRGFMAVGSSAKAGVVPKELYEKAQTELKRIQDLYGEALHKIASQQEVCKNCRADTTIGDWKATVEKLEQKTLLLEKAKVLLTRAANKEKNLREQIDFWKKKCQDLQNMSVIEEVSE